MLETVNGWTIQQQGFDFSKFKDKWIAYRPVGDLHDEYLHQDGSVHDACCVGHCVTTTVWTGYFDTREEAVAAAENYKEG